MTGVSPLKGQRKAAKPAAALALTRLPGGEGNKAALVASSAKAKAGERDLTFDRDVDRALARGRRVPEAKLDLHGMTLAAAERAVAHFLAESADQRRRVVIIVTGKGLRLEGGRVFGGRIRAEFPGWLERTENRTRIAGVRTAHPRHGGSGAFYVLLRRRTVRA